MKKFAWSLLVLVLVGSGIWAEVVEIPDPNLRKAVEQALYVEVGEDITKEVLARLTVLDANGRQIKNLSGIESCINLTELKLSFNQLTDLTRFNGANLPNLTQLDLHGNQLIDISGLAWANLPHLKTLKLDQNQITDLSGLAGTNLPKLQTLNLHQNPLSKDTVLNQIPKLKETIRTISFTSQSFLAPMTGDVNGDQIVNILDLVAVARPFGQTGAGLIADINEDGSVNIFDLVIVASNLGQNAIVAAPFILATIQLNRKQKYNIRQAIYQLENKTHKPADQQLTLNLLKTILSEEIPTQTQLLANYPNPFNPETWIPFELHQDTNVSLTIYDLSGDQIRRIDLGHTLAGKHIKKDQSIYWDGRSDTGEKVSTGTYFYTIQTDEYSATRKMVILK